MGISTWLLDRGNISGLSWMICVGLGSYLAYVPYGSVLFDRLVASILPACEAQFLLGQAFDALG